MGNRYDVVCIPFNRMNPSINARSHLSVPQELKRSEDVLWQAISFLIRDLQTSTVMAWFMLAMVTYPEVQERCQKELDRVIGRSRTPTFRDRESLPYIRATVRELFRWRTPAPIGELFANMNLFIHHIHRELGEAGVAHYTMEAAFSHCFLQTFQI